jgi:DNA-binding response OmpR family regulator
MKRLLVIEDDPELREALLIYFDHPDIEVLTAANGLEGVVTAYSRAPHVILLDLTMPDVDGFEVFEHLRAASFHPQIYFMTAQTSPDIVKRMKACAVKGIIPKPFPEDLRERVLGVLEVRDGQRASRRG